MSEPVAQRVAAHPLAGATIGFCGKLPARGDFINAGLPRRFVEPWHDWMECGLRASRDRLGDGWLAAWLEAPVWNFVLSPRVCGPDAVLGLWLPSVDRVGRYFPLTIAAVVPAGDPAMLFAGGGGFLALAEEAGRDALDVTLDPEALAARLTAAAASEASETKGYEIPPGNALWWSDGSGRVPAAMFSSPGLPDGAQFAAMIDAAGDDGAASFELPG